jgi:hypothetical protein
MLRKKGTMIKLVKNQDSINREEEVEDLVTIMTMA